MPVRRKKSRSAVGLEAALMFCDMRGFTELSNRLPEVRVLELLNI
jgi:class 3 adenylate cyclase